MVVSALIHWVEQFLLIGLISLAIVISIIRAYITKALRATGLSPLLVFSLLGILSVYGCIATIQRRARRRRVSTDEEYWIIDLEVVEGGSSLLMRNRQVVNHFFLLFFVSHCTLLTYTSRFPSTGRSIDGYS